MKKIILALAAIVAMGATTASAGWQSNSWGGNSYSNIIDAESNAGNATDAQAAAIGDNTATGTISGGASGQLTAVATDNNGNATGVAAAGELSGSAAGAMAADPDNASTAASTSAAGGSTAGVTTTNRWRSWNGHNHNH